MIVFRGVIILMMGLFLGQSLHAAKKIKVRLLHDLKKISIRGFDVRVKVPSGNTYRFLGKTRKGVSPILLSTLTLSVSEGDSQANEGFWRLDWQNEEGVHRQKVNFARMGELIISGEMLSINQMAVPQDLIILVSRAHRLSKLRLSVVAKLDLESYVMGVLGSEVPVSWPLETLKAQAVAARSYAWSVMNERWEKPYHVESTVKDQVYKFAKWPTSGSPVVNAVKSTEGEVLVHKDGEPFRAYYHSTCGGQTEKPFHVWKTAHVNESVRDDLCVGSPSYQWSYKISMNDLVEGSSSLFRSRQKSRVLNVNIKSKWATGRVATMEFAFENGGREEVKAGDLRRVLGYSRLKSTKFLISREGESLIFRGQGYGHGVGLCQWGSHKMGLLGDSYPQILKKYYPSSAFHIINSISLNSRVDPIRKLFRFQRGGELRLIPGERR